MGGAEIKKEEAMDQPTFISRNGMLADKEYIDQLSLDMRAMFPDEKGFSVTNLKYIKRWYSFYYDKFTNRQQPVDEIVQQSAEGLKETILTIRQQPVDEFKMPDVFGVIPWGHHINIFTKSKSLGEALCFAYLGRQKELRIDEETVFFPDLLFYHIPQRRYIIIELKAVKFMPEFAGKLNFYVTAADKLLRSKADNPSVGLLICKTAKKTIVEWSLQDIQKPLGVATYQLQEVVDRTVAELELRKKQKENNP